MMRSLAVGTGSWTSLVGVGRRVLVVEDNVDTAELFAALLERRGYEVAIAHDGHGALVHARTFAPDIVLLDLALPGIDGLEVARRLRASAPELRLLAITGYAQRRSEVFAAGFDAFLIKPVAMSAILAAIAGTSREPAARPCRHAARPSGAPAAPDEVPPVIAR